MKVAALFIDPRGPYANLAGVDPWPAERDARKYRGPWPVVAHPPCSRWCKLAPVVEARYGYRRGDDGGCFAAAIEAVRKYGGVVEHPAGSYAWAAFNLPRPIGPGWQLSFFDRGYVCEVSQRAYGHRAEKLTWLYYIGEAPPPELDWRRPRGEALVSFLSNHGCRDLPRLRPSEASRTPEAFRDELVRIARHATTVELMGKRERSLTPPPLPRRADPDREGSAPMTPRPHSLPLRASVRELAAMHARKLKAAPGSPGAASESFNQVHFPFNREVQPPASYHAGMEKQRGKDQR